MPTWFQSSLLLACAVVLGLISVAKSAEGSSFAVQWWMLAAVFLYLSADETAQIHEKWMTVVLAVLDALSLRPTGSFRAFFRQGIFLYAWVIPAGLALAAFALAYFRFFLALPVNVRWLCAISGGLYAGGAVGIEMAGGLYASLHGREHLGYSLLAVLEEVLEMGGAVLFLYTFLGLLAVPVAGERA